MENWISGESENCVAFLFLLISVSREFRVKNVVIKQQSEWVSHLAVQLAMHTVYLENEPGENVGCFIVYEYTALGESVERESESWKMDWLFRFVANWKDSWEDYVKNKWKEESADEAKRRLGDDACIFSPERSSSSCHQATFPCTFAPSYSAKYHRLGDEEQKCDDGDDGGESKVKVTRATAKCLLHQGENISEIWILNFL